jgi:hypothetical protein
MNVKKFAHTLFFFAILALSACSREPDEQLLRETIDQMQKAGESRDIGGVLDHVADDFAGQSASMTRDQLRAYLLAIRMRTTQIGVTRTGLDITLNGTQAKAEISFLVTDGGQILPNTGQYVRAQTSWRFTDGAWMLTNSDWTEGLSE